MRTKLLVIAWCALLSQLTIVPPPSRAADGTLTFSTFSFPPFSDSKDGKAVGPFVDVLDAICGEMRYVCTYEMLPNRRSKLALENGTVNGSFPLGWNKERDESLWFSIPLMKTEYGFFAHTESHFEYHSHADLQGLIIGVFGPSATATALTKIQEEMNGEGLKPIRIETDPNADTGLKKVAAGRYPLYFVSKQVGQRLIAEHGIANLKYVGTERELFNFAAFTKKHNDKRIVDKFNRAALKLANQGVLSKLVARHGLETARWDDATLKKYNIVIGPDTQ